MLNKENPSYYSILTADVRYSADINWFEKVLFSDITSLTNKNGYCTASNKYFAKVFGVSVRTISRAISNLSEYKFIQCVIVRDEQNEIIMRKIYLCHSVSIPMDKSVHTPMANSVDTPIAKNGVYNNTSNINNINNNNKKNINTKKENQYMSFMNFDGMDHVSEVFIELCQYDKLIEKFSVQQVHDKIIGLDEWQKNQPKSKLKKDHYSTLLKWLKNADETKSGATYRGSIQNANHGPILSQRQINNINAVNQAIAETSGMSHASDSE